MKKSILLIVLVLLAAAQSFAQHFDWVRGYAPGDNVAIVGSVTDSVGNLYILGNINFNSCWENGSRLLPIAPYGYASDDGDVLIAKVSPEGDLVWHKVIHGSVSNSLPHDIKLIGDTAFACLVTMPLATNAFYLYYLDTLVRESGIYNLTIPWPDYPISTVYYAGYRCLALITFDFDGNVQEQHFLQMSYLDYNGGDIVDVPNPATGPEPWLQTNVPSNPSFAIDGEGNIYLSHSTYNIMPAGPYNPGEYYTVEDGTISAIKIMCDHRVVGIVPTDSSLGVCPQIFKFSPHFDTLLESRYVFQNNPKTNFFSNHIQTDRENNLYYVEYTEGGVINHRMIIDSLKNMSVYYRKFNTWKGFLIKYNPSLEVSAVVSLDDSVLNYENTISNSPFFDIAFDYDSNLLFLSAATGRTYFGDTSNFTTVLLCQGTPLTTLKSDAFFLSFKFEADTLRFHSYGRVDAKIASQMYRTYHHEHGNLACKNNRVFLQSTNTGGVRFPGQNNEWSPWSLDSPGLTVFDYQGEIIGGAHYAALAPYNAVGPISLFDSTLYLINMLISDATFGDISVPSRGKYFACIAKYTDPAFMQPYRPVDINTVDAAPVTVYPNPATDRVHVTLPGGESVTEAYVVTLSGQRRRVPVGGHTVDLSTVPAGILFLQIVTNNRIYTHKIIKL